MKHMLTVVVDSLFFFEFVVDSSAGFHNVHGGFSLFYSEVAAIAKSVYLSVAGIVYCYCVENLALKNRQLLA